LKIAQVAPLYESVPPKLYGGTERVVSYLTEELVRKGHDITLFASGDSVTTARLATVCEKSLRLDPNCVDQLAYHVLMLERVVSAASRFDVIHFHLDYLHFPVSTRQQTPAVTTLHGRLDIPELIPLYRQFRNVPLISISDSQREPLAWVKWLGTIYHGLPEDLYSFREKPGDYLAFIGRVSPEKGVDRAIEIATAAQVPLRIAAKVDAVDREYHEAVVKPLLDHPLIEFVGEIGEDQKNEFLGNARGLLFPIDWPEPFGMVMIESMACGTPVVAFRRGSVPEVIDDGLTGWVVDAPEDAVEAVRRLGALDRKRCRRVFEERFTASRMADDYLEAYRSLVERPQALTA
jgi:glycosyltransferase involved in cell wall biosynthesis